MTKTPKIVPDADGWYYRRDAALPFQTWHPPFDDTDRVEYAGCAGTVHTARVIDLWWGHTVSNPESVILKARLAEKATSTDPKGYGLDPAIVRRADEPPKVQVVSSPYDFDDKELAAIKNDVKVAMERLDEAVTSLEDVPFEHRTQVMDCLKDAVSRRVDVLDKIEAYARRK